MNAIRNVILSLAALSQLACGTNETGEGTLGASTLSIQLTAAAADVAFAHAAMPEDVPQGPDIAHPAGPEAPSGASIGAAVVTISSIYLVGEAGNVILTDQPVTTDLMTLSNDLKTLGGGAVVPAGHYEQLRFVIDGAYIQVGAGDARKTYATADYAPAADLQVDGELQMPSYTESGFKVVLPDGGLSL